MNDTPAPQDGAPEPETLELETLEGLAGGAAGPEVNVSFN
jgi:hypothetical protein